MMSFKTSAGRLEALGPLEPRMNGITFGDSGRCALCDFEPLRPDVGLHDNRAVRCAVCARLRTGTSRVTCFVSRKPR